MAQRILFIHQNFPGQFVHVARELVRLGHDVVALGMRQDTRAVLGLRYMKYSVPSIRRASEVALAQDFEVKLARGRACAGAMVALQESGFAPDVIVAHPSWGEALFCKDIWPSAPLLVFAEFFYSTGSDFAFDPEFAHIGLEAKLRIRIKNSVHLHALSSADAGYSPTQWQRNQLPAEYRDRIHVVFDGIDTGRVRPDHAAVIHLKRDNLTLAKGDEVITFVNRNLEPYRGFHVLMRALPELLRERPNAHCLIVGGNEVSYGSRPKGGGSWREFMLREVGAKLPMDRVHFLGRLSHAGYLKVLQVSACHIYLTYPFVLSWSCLEAMSAGCVLVASATPPVQEVIEDGSNGLLFDFFDTKALVQHVASVLADPIGHQPLAVRARESVVARYDLKTYCLPRQIELVLEHARQESSVMLSQASGTAP
ncbi:MAG: glycosyltransferase [Planctomycetes bacterium]|jgi:glycosyltransferase involved in cell wall biosynthesis|nr:glycosyltransferase [Planctomycetota bacterium]